MSALRFALVLFTIVLTVNAPGQTTVTFSGVPYTSLTTYSIADVTFRYSGAFAYVGDTVGPSQPMLYVSPAWLTGHSGGTLTLDFDSSLSALGFGYALNGNPAATIANGITINLYDSFDSLITSFTETISSPTWSPEGRFDYTSTTPISSAVLSFRSDFSYYGWDPMFGIDNLTYTVVPEPGLSALVFGLFSSAVLALRARKQHRLARR